jgi:hypothetical protein
MYSIPRDLESRPPSIVLAPLPPHPRCPGLMGNQSVSFHLHKLPRVELNIPVLSRCQLQSHSSPLHPPPCYCHTVYSLLVVLGSDIRSREVGVSTFWVEMPMLAFREDPLLWRRDEDLRYRVQGEQEQRFEGCEGVAEIHEGRDEDKDIEDKGSDIAQRHCDDRRGMYMRDPILARLSVRVESLVGCIGNGRHGRSLVVVGGGIWMV